MAMGIGGKDEEKWTNRNNSGSSSSGNNNRSLVTNLEAVAINNEDILFCIDTGVESLVEMKLPGGGGGGNSGTSSSTNAILTRLDSIKQSILIFVDAKLSFNPDHRFAFLSFSSSSSSSTSASWLRKDFTSDFASASAALLGLSVSPDSSSPRPTSAPVDLTQILRVAAHEAKKSRALNRIFRVILIYCRSSSLPHYQWSTAQKPFTLDVIYLHDKPGSDNCPQKVFDALVDTLDQMSEYEGYIFECGQGSRLFRHMCTLLAHPQQRCPQDKLDIPRMLTRRSPEPESGPSGEESMSVSTGQ